MLTMMKQFQTVYRDAESFQAVLQDWKKRCLPDTQAIIRLFVSGAEEEVLAEACALIRRVMPDCPLVGNSANGVIVDGAISEEKLVIGMTLYEKPTSFVKAHLIPVDPDADLEQFRARLREEGINWEKVTAAELLMTISTIPFDAVARILDEEIPERILLIGGGAFRGSGGPFLFMGDSGKRQSAVLLLLVGGVELHGVTHVVQGWKPLGSELVATRSEGRILYELNGKPAFDTYHRYLRIPMDEHFFENTLEFPLSMKKHGATLFRSTSSCNPDGSLVTSTEIPEGTVLHTNYGDPQKILSQVHKCVREMAQFGPEVISVYSCFGRKSFWGDSETASQETRPLEAVAPVYGFCTSGELVRVNTPILLHNMTMVITGMREGGPVHRENPEEEETGQEDSALSLISRLVNYVNTATAEILEANRALQRMACTDRLTGLLNRGEIQKRIMDRMAECPLDSTHLIMLDLDDFKGINDVYGHQAGDAVLMGVSEVIRQVAEEQSECSCGRWGGEEFMILLAGHTDGEAFRMAEEIRAGIAGRNFPVDRQVTASIGIARAGKTERADPFIGRVDKALYQAKATGKNRVCTL
ncbi:MAG: diguanylate cyclase [Clostridia bacterium]|nr:diguanylate cyclase [Clostridia bacterium]